MRAPIGILGGTFDPIHFGHLRMAQELHTHLGLAEVRFIPAGSPPHRDVPHTPATHRAAMVRHAIADNPAFTLDKREITRPGASYTVDTLQELRDHLGPDTPLCLLMGGDAFLNLPAWHRWQELLRLAHIVVAQRPGSLPDETSLPRTLYALWRTHAAKHPLELHAAPAGRVLLHPMTALDISASAIRAALGRGEPQRYLLPDAVLDYIHAHHLYESMPRET